MELFITGEDDSATCVAVQGDISQAQFPANNNNPLEELLGTDCYSRHVLLDLNQGGFIDSSGVGWLLACHKRFLAGGGRLILFSLPPMIEQVIQLLRLQTILTIKPDQPSGARPGDPRERPVMTQPTDRTLPAAEEADDALWIDVESADVPFVVQGLLEHAASLNVSDMFFCAEENYLSVSARHLGLWQPMSQVSSEMGKRCIAHIKSMANMDVTERRRPLDGRWIFDRTNGETIDLRISTLPTLYGEDCTIRLLLRENQLLSIEGLGLLQRDHNYLLQMLNNPSGLILVTGPTGSGKTTTLYACVSYLNSGQRKINTIEDPIEYALVRVRQSQINPVVDVGFADLLRGVLRQAPDVIMIGEVRDMETAAIAVRAANSGHLVLATLHAPIAAAAVASMLTFGIHPYQLAAQQRHLLGCEQIAPSAWCARSTSRPRCPTT